MDHSEGTSNLDHDLDIDESLRPKYAKLRWAAAIPAAVLGSMVGPALVFIFNWLGSSGDPSRIEQFFLLVAQSAAMGAAFVWAGTYVAQHIKTRSQSYSPV